MDIRMDIRIILYFVMTTISVLFVQHGVIGKEYEKKQLEKGESTVLKGLGIYPTEFGESTIVGRNTGFRDFWKHH
jgi:hypothetical protein